MSDPRADQLEKALDLACWDLANYTFRGRPISLGEEAERLVACYLDAALVALDAQEPKT